MYGGKKVKRVSLANYGNIVQKNIGIGSKLEISLADYNTKEEFLAEHPQFAETTKFDECQLLITDSLESTSSKMEKAKKKNIPIKTYLYYGRS